jgi:hypothetical protein
MTLSVVMQKIILASIADMHRNTCMRQGTGKMIILQQ